jgi:hypothetical protein
LHRRLVKTNENDITQNAKKKKVSIAYKTGLRNLKGHKATQLGLRALATVELQRVFALVKVNDSSEIAWTSSSSEVYAARCRW